MFEPLEESVALWKLERPVFKIFNNGANKYLYDTGTNKIFKCTDIEFELLNSLIECSDIENILSTLILRYSNEEISHAIYSLKTNINKHSILKGLPSRTSFKSMNKESFENVCRENLNILILEVTQSCNLRCKYCLFDDQNQMKRQHGNISMDEDVAYKAIDLLATNSKCKDEVALTFYGGEPLLKFDLIKKAVEYAREIMSSKSISFSLTTNGTLLTESIAKYFAENNFNLVISLDGPKMYHNEYRILKNGEGSFDDTFRGINNLLKYYTPEMLKAHISISIVFAPPFSKEKLLSIQELFSCDSPLYYTNPRITFPIKDTVPARYYEKYTSENTEMYFIDWAFPIYFEAYPEITDVNPLVKLIMQDSLLGLQKRKYSGGTQMTQIPLNGCCIPSQRRIFVSADGKLHLCERVLNAPSIGSVENGIDYGTLYNVYIKEYSDKSIMNCSSCWSNKLCELCYISGFKNGNISISTKEKQCNQILNINEKRLIAYTKLLEKDITGLDYLSNMIVV